MHKMPVLVLAVVMLMLAGCAGGATKAACPLTLDFLDGLEEGASFQIDNQACNSLCGAYLAAADCGEWGENLLAGEPLPHGWSLTVLVPRGQYGMLIQECSGESYEVSSVDLREDGRWTYGLEGVEAGQACGAALTVVNQAEAPICSLLMATSGGETDGYNWLAEGEAIQPGQAMTFQVIPGMYDVRVEDCDGNLLRLDLALPILEAELWGVP